MVDQKKYNIGDLYKDAFKDYKAKEVDFSWFEMESKVTKLNFLKFNPLSFNIYYAVLIISTFLISLGVGIDYFLLSYNNNVEIENVLYPDEDTENIDQINNNTNISNRKLKSKTSKSTSSKKATLKERIDNLNKENKSSPIKGTSSTSIPDTNLTIFLPETQPDTTEFTKTEIVKVKQPPVILRDTFEMSLKKDVKKKKKR